MAEMGAALDPFADVETGEAFTVRSPRLLKVELCATGVLAKNGSMVAYRGGRVMVCTCAGAYARQ